MLCKSANGLKASWGNNLAHVPARVCEPRDTLFFAPATKPAQRQRPERPLAGTHRGDGAWPLWGVNKVLGLGSTETLSTWKKAKWPWGKTCMQKQKQRGVYFRMKTLGR